MGRSLSPFPVDPRVLARVHPMTEAHLPEVARLHAAMGTSLWSSLGSSFVRSVYRAFLTHPDFIARVYLEGGRVMGFIAGTADGPRMSRGVLLRHGPRLALATLRGLLRHPAAALPMLETLRYFGRSGPAEGGPPVRAESLFCSFHPDLRGKRVAGLINKVLFDELARRGSRQVKITTEAANHLAARQLTSWGFEDLGRFRFYGKEMITWRLDLVACPRVDTPG